MELPKKFCHNCGKQIPPVAKFCPNCGTSQASIDEKPPVQEPQEAQANAPHQINRLRPKQYPRQEPTFKPFIPGEGEDFDDETIRVDRINSISDLNLSLSALDVGLQLDIPIKETVGNVMKQGAALPLSAHQPGPSRSTGPIDTKSAMQQFQQEAGTLRK